MTVRTDITIKRKEQLQKFGQQLRQLRGDMSLRKAGTLSGLSHAYIADLEKGCNRSTQQMIIPSPDTLERLAIAYRYPFENLMVSVGHITEASLSSIKAEYLDCGSYAASIRQEFSKQVADPKLLDAIEQAVKNAFWSGEQHLKHVQEREHVRTEAL